MNLEPHICVGRLKNNNRKAIIMSIRILNRDTFQLPGDGYYMLAPFGEFPHGESGLMQVFDDKAAVAIVNRFNTEKAKENFAGLLVDQDHFSLDSDKASEAYGWITDLQNRKDGLWAQIRWSDIGEQAVRGGRYRFMSPVWNREDCEELGGNRIRPLRLKNAAVTNDPNFRGLMPLSNRNINKEAYINEQPQGISKKIYEQIPKPNKGAPSMDYRKMIIDAFGLPGTATDEELQKAVANEGDEGEGENIAERMKNMKAKIAKLDKENCAMKSRFGKKTAIVADKSDAEAEGEGEAEAKGEEGATDEELADKLKAKEEEAEELQNRVNELEAKELDGKVKSTLAKYASVIVNRAEVAADLRRDYDSTLRMLKNVKVASLPNRSEGRNPEGSDDDGIINQSQSSNKQAAAIANRAMELRKGDKRMTFTQSFKKAEAELKETK